MHSCQAIAYWRRAKNKGGGGGGAGGGGLRGQEKGRVPKSGLQFRALSFFPWESFLMSGGEGVGGRNSPGPQTHPRPPGLQAMA